MEIFRFIDLEDSQVCFSEAQAEKLSSISNEDTNLLQLDTQIVTHKKCLR